MRTKHRRERRTGSELFVYKNKIGKNVHCSKRKWRDEIISYDKWNSTRQTSLHLWNIMGCGEIRVVLSQVKISSVRCPRHRLAVGHMPQRGNTLCVCVCVRARVGVYVNVWSTITDSRILAHTDFLFCMDMKGKSLSSSLVDSIATGKLATLISHPACTRHLKKNLKLARVL